MSDSKRPPSTAPRQLDELDLAVVHALQIDARAPWTRVAAAVGADSATVARRWEQMREESLAWLTCWPQAALWESTTDLAMVRIGAAADTDALSALPWTITVEETSAGVVVLVASGAGLRDLGLRVLELAAAAGLGPGSAAPDMHVVSAVLAEDSMWRTGALDPRAQRIAAGRGGDAPAPPKPEVVSELAEALADDPRASAAAVASAIGVSEATARRAIDRAAASGRLGLGCDLSAWAAGFRRGAMLWAESPEPHVAGGRARRLPQSHRVLQVVGPAPLCISVRATTLTALPEIERALGEGTVGQGTVGQGTVGKGTRIVDRWTVLGSPKRNGHLLDAWGRTAGRVPVRW